MKINSINIEELKDYIQAAFIEDYELVDFYDKNVHIENTKDAIENIHLKIETAYPDADIFGVEVGNEKIGYFVCTHELLISFGLNVNYRDKETLATYWNLIKKMMADNFQCVLYSYNKRGLNFLQKGGMKILFDNVTILSTN